MGDRLRVEIDVPRRCGRRLPPMMVLTLAENAVKHGLGPKREGWNAEDPARGSQGRLQIEVRDDGVGLQLGAGGGRGLANTRARLATHFGREGGFEIGNNEEGGVSASLSLPLRGGAAAGERRVSEALDAALALVRRPVVALAAGGRACGGGA